MLQMENKCPDETTHVQDDLNLHILRMFEGTFSPHITGINDIYQYSSEAIMTFSLRYILWYFFLTIALLKLDFHVL